MPWAHMPLKGIARKQADMQISFKTCKSIWFCPFSKNSNYRQGASSCAREIKVKSCSDSVCQELGMDSVQKVECDPVIKSSVIMHLCKESN